MNSVDSITIDPLAARACWSLVRSKQARAHALAIGAEPLLIFRNPLLAELARRALCGESLNTLTIRDALDLARADGSSLTPAQLDATIDDLACFEPFSGDDCGAVERLAERESPRILIAVMRWTSRRVIHDRSVMPDVARELRRALERAAPHDDDREGDELTTDQSAAESARRVQHDRANALGAQAVAA